MIVHNHDQGSDEWVRARLGIPTASNFGDIITASGKPTDNKARKTYKYKLICERLLHQQMDGGAKGYWANRGLDMEEEAARAFWNFMSDTPDDSWVKEWRMERTGFATNNHGRYGASLDRLLINSKTGARQGLEIKCLSPWVHMDYLLNGTGEVFTPQMQGEVLVCEVECVHLWVYHPQMPPHHHAMLRDTDLLNRLAIELDRFCDEVDEAADEAKRLGPYKVAERLRLTAEIADDVLPGTFPWH